MSASWSKGLRKGDGREDPEGDVSPRGPLVARLNQRRPARALALAGRLGLVSLQPAASPSGTTASPCGHEDPARLCRARRREQRRRWAGERGAWRLCSPQQRKDAVRARSSCPTQSSTSPFELSEHLWLQTRCSSVEWGRSLGTSASVRVVEGTRADENGLEGRSIAVFLHGGEYWS